MKRTILAVALLATTSAAMAVSGGARWECQGVTQYEQAGSWDFPQRGAKLKTGRERVTIMFTPYSATVTAKAFGIAQFSEVFGENDYTRVYLQGEVSLQVSTADAPDHRGYVMSTPRHVIVGSDCTFKSYEN
ncbi:hypothetical protein CPT_Slocum_025 [Serratia phage Slocum]|nr:hypothetical protein CPT_Slocum_025 [Serratia phage Slocum]